MIEGVNEGLKDGYFVGKCDGSFVDGFEVGTILIDGWKEGVKVGDNDGKRQ